MRWLAWVFWLVAMPQYCICVLVLFCPYKFGSIGRIPMPAQCTNHPCHAAPNFFVYQVFCGPPLVCLTGQLACGWNQNSQRAAPMPKASDCCGSPVEDLLWVCLVARVCPTSTKEFLSTEKRPAMRWFLNVRIACSAAFCWWQPGGASWKLISI